MLTFPVLWGVEVGEEKASISFPTDTSGGSVDLAVECLGQYKPLLPKHHGGIYSESPISLGFFSRDPLAEFMVSHRVAF